MNRENALSVAALIAAVACVLPVPMANAAGSGAQSAIPPPQIVAESQTLSYSFSANSATWSFVPEKVDMVKVTLSLSSVLPTGAYVDCSTQDAKPPRYRQYSLKVGLAATVGPLMPSTDYYCFATSSPLWTADPAAWSDPFRITTRAPQGIATLQMTDEVWEAIGAPQNQVTGMFPTYYVPKFGPNCKWCWNSEARSWRWPLATAWRSGSEVQLPGGIELQTGDFGRGLDARLSGNLDVGLRVDIKRSIKLGWGTFATLTGLTKTGSGFTAQAYLTKDPLFLAQLPAVSLAPGSHLGQISVVQDFVPAVPSSPTGVRGTSRTTDSGKILAVFSWEPPSDDGGEAVLQYRYRTRINKAWSSWTVTAKRSFAATFTPGNVVTFQVAAINSAGPGPSAQISKRL